MSILDGIHDRDHLRSLDGAGLRRLAEEVRGLLVESVGRSGGHLGSNLGVVELTIALHRVFDSPRDRIVWDTGHQAYVHKMLTGRADRFDRLRRRGGLSGYPSRGESLHDLVENSHASTALSYTDGLARANLLHAEPDRTVVAVVGDGTLTGGMAWEALNNLAAAPRRRVVIVLNDNGRSYDPTVGGLARRLAEVRAGGTAPAGGLLPDLRLPYLGPVDGHDVAAVEAALRSARELGGTVLVHCLTEKGHGYAPAVQHEADRFHAVRPFDPASGQPLHTAAPSWTDVVAQEMVRLGWEREDVVAVSAAMVEPTGLAPFRALFPDRLIDVGIAEQHAVTSAAGLAMGGLHPVVCLYATFLTRAVDQVLLDVALHRLPVTFVLDRAGVTGDDGASHNGVWDLSLLQAVPGLAMAAPRDGATLRRHLAEAITIEGPSLVRFPKGSLGPDLPVVALCSGMDVLHRTDRRDVLLVPVGAMAARCVAAAEALAAHGIGVTVVDPGWVKPVNPALPLLAAEHGLVVTVEDGCRVGGFGSALAQFLQDENVWTPIRALGVPSVFLTHGSREEVLAGCRLTAQAVAETIMDVLPRVEAHRSSEIAWALSGADVQGVG